MTTATPPRWTSRLAAIALAPAHLVERTRGRKRVALLMLYAVIATVGAFLTWWSQSLRNLPDIGDPFDVQAFQPKPVAEADNGFPLYLQAADGLKTLSYDQRNEIGEVFTAPWPLVKPKVRESLQLVREPLLLWKQATERPGLDLGEAGKSPSEGRATALNDARITFPFLAILEAARLADQGDLEAAWPWYRAVLRAQGHVQSLAESGISTWRLGFTERTTRLGIVQAVARWAADPRVDAVLLRQALTEALAIDAALPSFTSSLRGSYRWSVNHLKAHLAENQDVIREDEWYKATPLYWPAVLFLNREPERSRRILRLIYANLAAHVDDPPSRRPRLVSPGIFDTGRDPSGNDPSRRIMPQDLQAQIAASRLPKHLVGGNSILFMLNAEQTARATILIDLASQLYEREHGKPPTSDADLVGTYLERLPKGAIDPTSKPN